jgi:hypothetical protein
MSIQNNPLKRMRSARAGRRGPHDRLSKGAVAREKNRGRS